VPDEPDEPKKRRPVQLKLRDDPYCGFKDDKERRNALNTREVCRLCGRLALAVAIIYVVGTGASLEPVLKLLQGVLRLV
jgi:hypothetical protein